MENEIQNHEKTVLEKKLRKQLAVAVRSVQWSYAIFWSLSSKEEGVLEWQEGYYNGDIKTRKTVPTMELKADKSSLQRSEQLRELYKSLLEDDTDQPNNINNNNNKSSPSSLSPEDLTDAEWFYLVCMSFNFKPAQGLPGRALADGKTVWLCNADYADSKVFTRSLLAKSASIQTVVCFPHLGGVIEIGVTDLVPEDLNLLQHIKASLLDFSKPDCADDIDNDDDNDDGDDDDEDQMPGKIIDRDVVVVVDECSNGFRQSHAQAEDSFMIEASQVQSWHFMDDDVDLSIGGVGHSSDCISEAFAGAHLTDRLQRFNDTKLSSLDIGSGAEDDLHYKRTIAVVLGGSPKFVERLSCSCESGRESSFVAWKNGPAAATATGDLIQRPRSGNHQKTLKTILFTVPFMYEGSYLEPPKKELCKNSLLDKTDKETVLNNTIKYLKELEARVEELESCTDRDHSVTRKGGRALEQMSENCDADRISGAKKAWGAANKRKASDMVDESDDGAAAVSDHGGGEGGLSLELKVRVRDQEVLIDMECPYKEYILLDIMEAINHLHMDSHSVQSSTIDGVFTLSLKSKFRGTAIAPVGMIKQALWKVCGSKC